MIESLGISENTLRMSVFFGVFAFMAALEFIFPRVPRSLPRGQRWLTNSLIVVIDSLALRILLPMLAVGMATYASNNDIGLFNQIHLPLWFEVILAIILLDAAIYLQHWASHKLPILWRFHQVHHADRDIDVTTALRFHPIEILLSMLYKLLLVFILGPAALAVLLFEVILNASAMFNHSNMKIPLFVDKWLRRMIITPDMHRVHHSVYPVETNSNYGFFLSIWDRLFRTYIAQPQDGHTSMCIGLSEYQTNQPASLIWSLSVPFKSKK